MIRGICIIMRTFYFAYLRSLKFDFNLNLKFGLDLNQSDISNSNNDDKASLEGDYCSLTIGVLQISSTTRNLIPRFKREVKGKVRVKKFLGVFLVLVVLLEEVDPLS